MFRGGLKPLSCECWTATTAFEAFHITRNESASRRTTSLLTSAGIPFRESVTADGAYVIEVHGDDLGNASHSFSSRTWDPENRSPAAKEPPDLNRRPTLGCSRRGPVRQGGVISPLLANIYLHEVLDVWFETVVKPRLRGRARLIRYADDFVICFQREDDARRVAEVLPKRFAKYGLTLHPDKTRLF